MYATALFGPVLHKLHLKSSHPQSEPNTSWEADLSVDDEFDHVLNMFEIPKFIKVCRRRVDWL
jgi:hypothetical protein